MYGNPRTKSIDDSGKESSLFVVRCTTCFSYIISPRRSQHTVNNDPYTYCSTCTFLMQIACVCKPCIICVHNSNFVFLLIYFIHIFIYTYLSLDIFQFWFLIFIFIFFFFILFSIIQRVHLCTNKYASLARNLLHLERIINCIDVLFYGLLRPKSSDSRRIAILCFTFAYCIVSCIIVSRHVSSLLAFQFFSLSLFFFFFYLHVMSLHDPFLFDLILVNIYMYTWRDLKLIEIQIETDRHNYFLLAIIKIYSN